MNGTTLFRAIVLGGVLLVAANPGHAANDVSGAKPSAFLDRGTVTLATETDKASAVLRLDLINGTAELMANTPLQLKTNIAPASKQAAERLAAMPIRVLGTGGQTEAAICVAETNNLIRAIQSVSESCADPQSQACASAQINYQTSLIDFGDCLLRHFTQEN
jgi:hypothetical protein